jgi:hypothetical protein
MVRPERAFSIRNTWMDLLEGVASLSHFTCLRGVNPAWDLFPHWHCLLSRSYLVELFYLSHWMKAWLLQIPGKNKNGQNGSRSLGSPYWEIFEGVLIDLYRQDRFRTNKPLALDILNLASVSAFNSSYFMHPRISLSTFLWLCCYNLSGDELKFELLCLERHSF